MAQNEFMELLEEIKDFVYEGVHKVVGIIFNEETDEAAVQCNGCDEHEVLHPLNGSEIVWDTTIPTIEKGNVVKIAE